MKALKFFTDLVCLLFDEKYIVGDERKKYLNSLSLKFQVFKKRERKRKERKKIILQTFPLKNFIVKCSDSRGINR